GRVYGVTKIPDEGTYGLIDRPAFWATVVGIAFVLMNILVWWWLNNEDPATRTPALVVCRHLSFGQRCSDYCGRHMGDRSSACQSGSALPIACQCVVGSRVAGAGTLLLYSLRAQEGALKRA